MPVFHAPLRIAHVTLSVRNLEAMAAFYAHVLGFDILERTQTRIFMGTEEHTLLVLEHEPDARHRVAGEAGLFHNAFLLPDRSSLAQWVQYAANEQIPITGASDHKVSEAFYLSDPEGNGIEIYADRPRAEWTFANGMVEMTTEPLKIEALMDAREGKQWQGFPLGGSIGHVHLQVGDVKEAEAFYTGILGLDVMCRYPGATFFSAGGYHHHIATNVWNSRGAGERNFPVHGLKDITLHWDDAAHHAAIRAKAAKTGIVSAEEGSTFTIRDPWGNAFTMVQSS